MPTSLQTSAICGTLAAFALLGVTACSENSTPAPTSATYLQAGRFRIVTVPGASEVIEIDTATGKTWRLARYAPEDGGGVSGWEPIEDLK
jgi:hypothetical protein